MIPLRDNIKSGSFPFVNWILISMNAFVFYVMLTLPSSRHLQAFMNQYAVVPKHLFADPIGQALTLLTATFLHGGWLHIIFNMLFLFIFGDNVEDRLGHLKYFLFYLLAAVLANCTHAFFSSKSMIPLVGASGAIAGVLGAYFFYYPHAKVLTLIPLGLFSTIREIPAFFFLGLWFLLQTFNGALSISAQVVTRQEIAGGVAWWAHASGFIWGLLMSPIFGSRRSKYK
jgi:membrane associated rhomboid family serine protease